jgi:hypothetical protein
MSSRNVDVSVNAHGQKDDDDDCFAFGSWPTYLLGRPHETTSLPTGTLFGPMIHVHESMNMFVPCVEGKTAHWVECCISEPMLFHLVLNCPAQSVNYCFALFGSISYYRRAFLLVEKEDWSTQNRQCPRADETCHIPPRRRGPCAFRTRPGDPRPPALHCPRPCKRVVRGCSRTGGPTCASPFWP